VIGESGRHAADDAMRASETVLGFLTVLVELGVELVGFVGEPLQPLSEMIAQQGRSLGLPVRRSPRIEQP
jgi:hypothetical protein